MPLAGREQGLASSFSGTVVNEALEDGVKELRAKIEECMTVGWGEGVESGNLSTWLTEGQLTNVELLRFLLHADENVDKAWQHLLQIGEWRKVHVDNAAKRDWGSFSGADMMFWLGKDREGIPTLMMRTAEHTPGAAEAHEFEEYFTYLMEQARHEVGVGKELQINLVLDRKGVAFKNQDPGLLRKVLPLVNKAYPEILNMCFVAPSNALFTCIWKVVSKLISTRTAGKFTLLRPAQIPELLEKFDPAVLPTHLGGSRTDYPPANGVTWGDGPT
ncbi:unnamed protein product [Chrysoparadoxa australica]